MAEVGYVEALDPHRQRVEAERLAQVVERVDPLLASPLAAELVLLEREACVSLGELVNPALLTPARVPELDWPLPAVLQQLLHDLRSGERSRSYDLRRDRERRRVVL